MYLNNKLLIHMPGSTTYYCAVEYIEINWKNHPFLMQNLCEECQLENRLHFIILQWYRLFSMYGQCRRWPEARVVYISERAFILNILFSKQHKFNDTCAFQIYTHWISFHHSKQNCISLSPWEFVTIMHLFYNWYLKLRLTNVFTFDIPFDVCTCLFSGNELISMCH